jgi:hypothetical protein
VKYFDHDENAIGSGASFEDRATPDAASSALGHVALSFSRLDDTVSEQIAALLGTDDRAAATAKAKQGLRTQTEILTAAGIMDVADFVLSVAVDVEGYFMKASSCCLKPLIALASLAHCFSPWAEEASCQSSVD